MCAIAKNEPPVILQYLRLRSIDIRKTVKHIAQKTKKNPNIFFTEIKSGRAE